MNQEISRVSQGLNPQTTPATVPPAPTEPINCYAAKAIRWLLEWDGLDPSALPDDLSRRLARGDEAAIPEWLWSFFAQNYRDEQGKEILQLYRYHQQAWATRPDASCSPNELCDYLPIELLGKSQLRLFVEIYDRYYLRLLGLEKGRNTVEGYVIYPYAEQAFDEARRKLIAVRGLNYESQLNGFIRGLGEYYPYLPKSVSAAFADPEIAHWVVERVKELNPDLIKYTID